MIYHDRIYGTAEITAPVLLALLQSRAVQRLRGVLQHGVTALLGITSATTRFEHSVGVMLLAQRFGAPLQEQIAALLHDVSHTAFSHVLDHVFRGPRQQSFHEEKKAEYLAATDLPNSIQPKLRTLDPHVLRGDKLHVLSTLDENFARMREQYLVTQGGIWPMRIVARSRTH